MAEHKHAALLRAVADGEKVEVLLGNYWFEGDKNELLRQIGENVIRQNWRIKPKMLNINGKEFPEPLREASVGALVYWPNIEIGCVSQSMFSNEYLYKRLLKNGFLHDTPEAAQAHLDAILSVTRK